MINRLKWDTNADNIILNLTTNNLPKKSSLINLKINLTADILEKMTVCIKLFQQSDMEYGKEFMRIAFDLEKFLNGGISSFVGKTFLGGLADAADFPLKFPFTKVNNISIASILQIYFLKTFKGIYNLRNYTVTDQYIRFFLYKDFILDFRFTGNTKAGSRKMVFYAHVEAFISILPD